MSFVRTIVAGTGFITAAGGAARLIGIATVPVLTPLLGPTPYGAAALVMTLLGLASMLALMGIDMSYARFYLQEDPAQRVAVERFCWRFAAVGTLITGVLLAGGWYFGGSRWIEQHGLIAGYSFFALVLLVLVPMMTTRVRLLGDYRRLALSLVTGAVASAIVMIAMALFWRRDVWVLLLGTLASSIAALAVLGMPSGSFLVRPSELGSDRKRAVWTLGIAGAVTAPAYWIISSADRWFLAVYRDPAEIGIYSLAASIATVGLMLNNSVTLTWFPEASRVYGERGAGSLDALGLMWERLVIGLAVVWLAVAAAGGDMLRLLADESFHTGVRYVPFLAGGIFFYGLASLANTSLFLAARMRYTAWIWTVGGALSLVLNRLLVPVGGALAAALVQTVILCAIAIGVITAAQRILPLPLRVPRLIATLCVVAAVGTCMAPPWSSIAVLSLILKFPVGVLVTALLLRVCAPDWFDGLVARVTGISALAGRSGA